MARDCTRRDATDKPPVSGSLPRHLKLSMGRERARWDTESAVFAPSRDGAGIRAHQGESTDRFLGGSYYLRLPDTSAADAPLFRIDAGDGTVECLVDAPNLLACYRAPQMLCKGTIAAYRGCDRVKFSTCFRSAETALATTAKLATTATTTTATSCTAGCTLAP